MRALLSETASALAAAFAAPYRQFFRWNAAKALAVLHFAAFGFLLCLPGVVLMTASVLSLQARVSSAQVSALASAVEPQETVDAARDLLEASGKLPVLGVLAAVGLLAAAIAFAAGYASQVLYQDVLLRAAQGSALPPVPPLWRSGLALRKYASVFSWASLWAGLALLAALAVDAALVAPAFGALGWNEAGGGYTPYWLFNKVWYGAFSVWAGLKFGFAPLAMLSDLRASRTGRSYVAEGWKFASGPRFWRLAAAWVAFSAAAFIAGKLLLAGLLALDFWFVPAAALVLAVLWALRAKGPAVGRCARALGLVAAFCLSFLLDVLAYQVVVFAPLGYLAGAYFPTPVAAATAFAFLGLAESLRAVLWVRWRDAA